MASIDRRMHRSRVETPAAVGISQRGVTLSAATFVLAVSGGYLWLVWLHPLLMRLLGGAAG
jgi:hypothetical protein